MRIVCVGGGPAGLTFAILMKAQDPAHDVLVLEREAGGTRPGWGVVFGEDMVESLREVAAPLADEIESAAARWIDQVVVTHGHRSTPYPSTGFSIGRGRLLDILIAEAARLGVEVRPGHRIEPADVPEADLVVASDGVNSMLRTSRAAELGPAITPGANRYVWLGTRKVFREFTFAFVQTRAGWVWFHAYGFDATTSTCIVECSEQTWRGLGFDTMPAAQALVELQRLFAEWLGDAPLLALPGSEDMLPWLTFGTLQCTHWSVGNVVLMGDAAHTAHFSIGSGTKLAIGDAIGLANALRGSADLATALQAYELDRRAGIAHTVNDARLSREWFEHVPRYMTDDVERFAALMHERRSPLLPKLPPGAYYQLHRQSRTNPVLRKVRDWVGPAVQAVLARRSR